MPRLRQLPQIYLRGAIANETMRGLPAEDRQNINALTMELASSPILAGHRQEFIMRLGHTIGGDYRDDRATAEAEFQIAIWRALVYLLHHTSYSYKCDACGAAAYSTQRNKIKNFDRRYPICLNCNHVRISDPGATNLAAGDFISYDRLQEIVGTGVMPPPLHTSPISPIRGEQKVADHHTVLNDPEQLGKFFGEFIWNYFRQHLRENEIKYHAKSVIPIAGPADKIAVEECLSLLIHEKVVHCYQPGANPHGGLYRIQVDLDCQDVVMIKKILALRLKYQRLGVSIIPADHDIVVVECKGAVATVEASIIRPQVVAMQSRVSSIRGDDEDSSIFDVTLQQAMAGGRVMQEDGIARIETEDLLDAIRSALPDGAQQVLDIITQTGETWQRFCLPPSKTTKTTKEAKSRANRIAEAAIAAPPQAAPPQAAPPQAANDRPPPESHIARFLGVSPRQIKQWLTDIRLQCLAHNIGE